jgi:hypothetical protein
MSIIGKHNYQEYIVDYFDSRLSNQQIEELWAFLKSNPEFEEEFYSYQDIIGSEFKETIGQRLDSESIKMLNKDLLKKTLGDITEINERNFEEFCVASLEGDLSAMDQGRLNQYITNNSEKKKDLVLIQKTFLVADDSIRYPAHLKRELKQAYSISLRTRIYASIAAAAAIIIAITLFLRPVITRYLMNEPSISKSTQMQKPAELHQASINANEKAVTANSPTEQLSSGQATANNDKRIQTSTVTTNTLNDDNFLLNKHEPLEYLSGLTPDSIPVNTGTDTLINNPLKTYPTTENKNLLAVIPIDRSVLENLNNIIPEIEDTVSNLVKETTLLSAAKFTIDNVGKVLGRDKKLEYKVDENGKLIAFGYGNLGYSTTRGQK